MSERALLPVDRDDMSVEEYLEYLDVAHRARQPKPAPVSSEERAATTAARKSREMPKHKKALIAYLESTYGDLLQSEYLFHPVRKWRLDWAIDPDGLKIAIEFQGMFGGKAHRSINNVIRDQEKMIEAQLLGWLYLQVNTSTLRSGIAYDWIERAVAIRRGEE